jgi:hypothetical protein
MIATVVRVVDTVLSKQQVFPLATSALALVLDCVTPLVANLEGTFS